MIGQSPAISVVVVADVGASAIVPVAADRQRRERLGRDRVAAGARRRVTLERDRYAPGVSLARASIVSVPGDVAFHVTASPAVRVTVAAARSAAGRVGDVMRGRDDAGSATVERRHHVARRRSW